FILTTAMDSLRRAEERATQSLISKLETGLNDRLDALLQTQPDPNPTHSLLAGIYSSLYISPTDPNGFVPGPQRANVIAVFDYIKRELPDVFYIRDPGVLQSPPSLTQPYLVNFAGNPFPVTNPNPPVLLPYGNFILPLGQGNINTGEGIYGAS